MKQKNAGPPQRGAISITDSLRANEALAKLLPSVSRLAAIQKDCLAALPELFKSCGVLRFHAGELVLTATNAAMASRLKQNVPNLQQELGKTGWEVISIRIKVQPERRSLWQNHPPRVALPQQAIQAFAELENTLEKTPRNEALRMAIHRLISQKRGN
jgi:hypothetical protein